jgi:hypothetical protein
MKAEEPDSLNGGHLHAEPSADDDLDLDPLADEAQRMEDYHARERRALARCANCGSPNIRRSRTEGIIDKFHRIFGRRAYRCRDCRDRFHARPSLME